MDFPANASHGKELAVFVFLFLIGAGALLMPLTRYLLTGWLAKRKDILDGLSVDACQAYFEMFSPVEKDRNATTAREAFESLYSKWYGRQHYRGAAVLLFLAGGLSISAVALTGLHRFGFMANPLFDLPDTAMAAIAGAYLWIVTDHISRSRRLDFSPSDVQWAVLRLVIAIPMGYAFAALITKDLGPFIAFAIGAFPLSAITSMLKNVAEKKLDLAPTEAETRDDVSKLQGINKAVLERLSNEDISTVTQLAYCDPVRVVMRSNLSFTFVTDCMNQALAWTYLEQKLATLRPMSLRGATEISNFVDAHDNLERKYSKEDQDLAVRALPRLAQAVNQDPDTLLLALREIAGDPFTVFLKRVWATTGLDSRRAQLAKEAERANVAPPRKALAADEELVKLHALASGNPHD